MEIKQLPRKTSIHKQLRWNELKISIFLEVREIYVPDLVDANQSGPAVVKQKQAGQCDPPLTMFFVDESIPQTWK